MILRKPYAFLIKHFRLINLALFILVAFSLTNLLKLYSFIKDYIATGIYNITLTPISNYINGFIYLLLVVTVVLSIILFYLLKRKDKPFITYIYVILLMIANIVLFIFTNGYFSEVTEFNRQMTLLYKDFTLIVSIFYYPVLLILAVRFMGVDLKNFGFYEDKQFIEASDEDREEVEVEVAFDRDRYIRNLKNKIRYTKYFILEHKLVLICITVGILVFGVYNFYNYLYVENRIYKQNEKFVSNYYEIRVNNTYLTDKDFAGNVISTKNRYFIVLDVDVRNTAAKRVLDAENFMIYADDKYYVPTVRYNKSFADMGVLFSKDLSFPYNEVKNVLFVYEIDKPRENTNFLLKYQDLVSKSKKTIRIKLKIRNISSFKEKGNASLTNELKVPLNLEKGYTFSFSNYEITDQKAYTYESCHGYNCPIYEGTLSTDNNKKLLFLKLDTDTDTNSFLSFLKKYGRVRYTINGEIKEEKINYKITKYRGSYVYLEVSNEISNASSIELVFIVRTYQYNYKIKG